jgi:hypothetical protein
MLFDFANVLVFTALGTWICRRQSADRKAAPSGESQARKLSTYECGEPAMAALGQFQHPLSTWSP